MASGVLNVLLDEAVLASRTIPDCPTQPGTVGRGLFAVSRAKVTDAEQGGCTLFEAASTASPVVSAEQPALGAVFHGN